MVGTYKCPGCGAPIEFDGITGKLKCEYCGTSVDVSKMDAQADKYDCEVEEIEKRDEKFGDFSGFKCGNCGAEIITDEQTSATTCSYCGSPALIKERVQGQLMPDDLIPFKVNEQKAKDLFREWTKKGPLTPACFRKQAVIDNIKGIYVPFWLYDFDAHVDMRAEATKVKRETKGDTEYTHTSYYDVNRSMNCSYDRIPADASEKMPDNIMERLEPFDYADLRKFEMPYLSGYYSEKYNYTQEQMNHRAESRARRYAFLECRESITGYDNVHVRYSQTKLKKRHSSYALMPVWMLNYIYNGKQFTFAINGQTGKLVGNLPVSIGKAVAWFAGITAGVSGVLLLLGGILG